MKFYLAGPIWFSPDEGVSWRELLTKKLNFLGHKVSDPTKKEDNMNPTELKELRRIFGRKSEQVTKITNYIVEKDLTMIEESDALIAYLPKESQSFGSIQEIFYCKEILKQPVFVITDMDYVEEVPVFLDRTTTEFFHSFSDLIKFLAEFSQ